MTIGLFACINENKKANSKKPKLNSKKDTLSEIEKYIHKGFKGIYYIYRLNGPRYVIIDTFDIASEQVKIYQVYPKGTNDGIGYIILHDEKHSEFYTYNNFSSNFIDLETSILMLKDDRLNANNVNTKGLESYFNSFVFNNKRLMRPSLIDSILSLKDTSMHRIRNEQDIEDAIELRSKNMDGHPNKSNLQKLKALLKIKIKSASVFLYSIQGTLFYYELKPNYWGTNENYMNLPEKDEERIFDLENNFQFFNFSINSFVIELRDYKSERTINWK